MYSLLIADDESSSRYGLSDCFDWRRYNIEVVGLAQNGAEAMALIERYNPHIVITDVKMPVKDGIQLSKEIRKQSGDTKIIFISGYDDLEYIKAAMKLDAADYILKPIDFSELDEVVRKVVSSIEESEKKSKLVDSMSEKLTLGLPALREKFFLNLIHHQAPDLREIKKMMDMLEMNIPSAGSICVFAVSVDNKRTVYENINEKDRQFISTSLINICQRYIDEDNKGYVFETGPGEYACILYPRSGYGKDSLFALANTIKDNIAESLDVSVTIGVGKPVPEISGTHESYKNAVEAVKKKLILGRNRVILFDEFFSSRESSFTMDTLPEERIFSVLKAADKGRIDVLLDEVFAKMAHEKDISIEYCRIACLQLFFIAFKLLRDMDMNAGNQHLNMDQINKDFLALEILEDMKNYTVSCFHQVCDYIHDRKNDGSSFTVRKMKQIIHERYAGNITLQDIAQEVYLAVPYACTVFKQEAGITINEYLTRIRIEKAKDLLKEHQYKLYEICHAVGYTDPAYFSKLFKKYTGLNPNEYRNMD